MKRQLLLDDLRSVDELAMWFRHNRDELLLRAGVAPARTAERVTTRETSHTMDHGRDAPELRPTSGRTVASFADDAFTWEVTADVARWNPQEVATASLQVRLDGREGLRLRISRYVRDTAMVDALDVEILGATDPDGLFGWLDETLNTRGAT